MNKDLDERLIPDGEYRDASNIQIASTEGDDAGTVQNILGNHVVSDTGMGGVCIGMIENTETDKLYMFIKGTSVHGIVEYTPGTTPVTKPIILDARTTNDPLVPKVLDFSKITKITGITILDNFLIFTDDNSEPKIINLDISVSTGFFNSNNSETLFNYTSKINDKNFEEKDITLITKKPDEAPGVRIKVAAATKTATPIFENKFVRFAYRFVFNNGQRSPISPFTQPVFLPSATNSYDIDEGFNNQMENNIDEARLFEFDTSHNSLESIEIIYKESNNANIYLYDSISKADAILANTNGYIANKTVKKSVIPEDQLLRAFDNIPHKAKAVEVVGNRIVFGNYEDGLDVSDYSLTFDTITRLGRNTIDAELTRRIFIGDNNSTSSGVISGTGTGLYDTRTIKTGREYEIGVVFEDEYGRQTPVITADGGTGSGTLKVPFETGTVAGTKLGITMAGSFPSNTRLTKFKYYIKPSSNNFDNLIVETVKNDKEDSATCWLVVPSYEINKVKEGQYMMLKKALNSNARLTYDDPNSTPPITPDDYKFKILDISSGKPENIDAVESFDGKFFIKVKKTSQITDNIFTNQGLAGANGEILEIDFKQGNSSSISNALFLGQVTAPDSQDRVEVIKFYFKDGNIFEVVSSAPIGSNLTEHFQQSVVGSSAGGAYADLAGHVAGYDSSLPFADGDNSVTKVEVKYNSSKFPTSFQITYSSQNSNIDVASAGNSPAVFETIPDDEVLDIYYETSECFDKNKWGTQQDLSWHNAYIMGNGVESSTINDDFNENVISPGVKVSTTIEGDYKERNQKSSLIYSGIYNSLGGINKLNEFNTGLKITKELNPEYGSIQKLYTRDTNILAFCEDKVLKVLANKDALFNADGNINLTATENVLGQAIAFAGDYGISRNPESFAVHGYRIYFTDKARGAVLRISGDGSTVISEAGMSSFFRENLLNENNTSIIGSYDIHSDQYILSLGNYGSSISYSEDTKGWVSKLDFIPDTGISLNGKYYTCYTGKLYEHHYPTASRGNFYGQNRTAGVKLIFNQEASAIKNFKNIIYEGTTGWSITGEGIKTDQQEGKVIEFKEKEGKYFGLISGVETELDTISGSELDSRLKDFSIQGLGNIASHSGTETFGCANAALSINSGVVGAAVTGAVTSGTIQSISPSTYQTGTVSYTATILVPSGFDNSGSTILCSDSAGATNAAFTCADANLQIAAGTVGTTVSGSVDLGTIASYNPTTYSSNANTQYKAIINIPSGYTNSGTIECEDTNVTVTTASCAFTLTPGSTYSSGSYTLRGNFSGTDYNNSDTVTLSVVQGNIGIGSAGSSQSVNTTKSALAGQLTIYTNQAVTVTATITSGLCNTTPQTQATAIAPQSATVAITGSGTAMVGSNVTLTASTTGTVTSHQWYKSSSSGFTPGSSNAISGATSATLITSESSAGTQYYKVKINGTTDSAQHSIVWSAWTAHNNLKFASGGTSANSGACTETNTLSIFGNGSFTAATQFAVNNQGSTSGFQQGTYSDGTNYRFINSGGVPGAHTACSAGGGSQGIRASRCDNSSSDQNFLVDLDGNDALAVGNVISFTSQQFSNDYWKVEAINLTLNENQYDSAPTLASTHNSCTLMLTPTVDVTSPVAASFIYEGGSLKTRTLSAATRSNEPQGVTPTFQWKGGTAANSLSNISGATNETLDVNFNTVSNSAGQTTYYNCVVTYTESGNTKTATDATPVSIRWDNFPSYTLNRVNAGSASSPSATACTDTSNQVTLYGNHLTNIAATTQFYSNSQGSTSGIAVGTYSNGSVKAYVNAGGSVASSWTSCTSFAISGATSGSSFATVILTANETGFAGTNFRWTADNVEVQNGSNNSYGATVANTFNGNVTYGCTVTGGTASGQFDSHQVSWAVPSQKVTAQLCPAGVTYNFNITNAAGYTNGQVINLAGSGFTNGCYKVTNQNYTGSVDYSATVAGSYPFAPSSSCCDCTGCSVSINGVGTKEINTSTTLTASVSGFSATGYQWSESTDNSTFTNISGANSVSLSVTSSSAGSKYYKVVATASGITQTSSAHTISWFANNPVERWYQAEDLQSNCTTAANQVITVRYTSVNALSNGTVFEAPDGNTTTCYTISGSGSGDSSNFEIQTFYNSCTACQNANAADCSFSLSTSGNYNSSNGTATVTGTFGSGHTGTVSIGFNVSSGTVSPTSATKSQLTSGVTLTLSPNVTLTGTINSSDSCTGDQATVQIPQSSCNSVTAYYTTGNPATDTSAANDLCGNGTARSLYINGTTLANSTQVYTASGCGTLMSGTKYYSTDNSNYYIWNGYSLAGPYNLNCP